MTKLAPRDRGRPNDGHLVHCCRAGECDRRPAGRHTPGQEPELAVPVRAYLCRRVRWAGPAPYAVASSASPAAST